MRVGAILGLAVAAGLAGYGLIAADPDVAMRDPGLWKTDVRLLSLEIAGVEGSLRDQVRPEIEKSLREQFGSGECLTAERAAQEDIVAELSDDTEGSGRECKWSKLRLVGGKIDAVGTCVDAEEVIDMEIVGEIEPRRVDLTVATRGTIAGRRAQLSMQITGSHMGACEAQSS